MYGASYIYIFMAQTIVELILCGIQDVIMCLPSTVICDYVKFKFCSGNWHDIFRYCTIQCSCHYVPHLATVQFHTLRNDVFINVQCISPSEFLIRSIWPSKHWTFILISEFIMLISKFILLKYSSWKKIIYCKRACFMYAWICT